MSPFKCQISDFRFHQICTLIGSFCLKYTKFQLKGKEVLCLMTVKNNAKFDEKPICCFKNDKNLVNLIQALKSLKKFEL